MSDLLVGKKLVGPFLRKTVFFIFWGPLKFLLASKTLFCIRNPNFGGVILLRFFDPSNSLWDSQGGFSQKMKFSTFKPLLQSKNVRSMTPPKLGFLMPNKVLEAQKNFQKTPKMKKTVFLKNGPTNFFPTNIPDISEPHGDLLHWNFSWAFTFYISVYEEGSVDHLILVFLLKSERRKNVDGERYLYHSHKLSTLLFWGVDLQLRLQ